MLLQTRQRGVAPRGRRGRLGVASLGDCGAMPLRKRDGRAALPAARCSRQRPAECQMRSGPGDSDIEQPAFLFDRLTVGAVRQRMRDGQRAVGQPDQEHRVPLQPLRGVQRRQCDALHDRWMARVGALPQLGDQGAQGPATAARDLFVDEFGQRGERLPSLTRLGARRRFGGEPERLEQPRARCLAVRHRRPVLDRVRRPAAAPAAPAGSPGG